jgi:hypothetical protein
MGRQQISKKIRFEVFKRDGFVCQYCGNHPPDVLLQVDHIHPVKLGGDNDLDNLITSCQPCNIGKFATPLSVAPQSLAEKAADVAEREAQIRAYNEIMAGRRDRIEEEVWVIAEALIPGSSEGIAKSKYYSIKRFAKEVGIDACLEAVDIAFAKFPRSSRKRFLYFCGICWRKIRGKTEEQPPEGQAEACDQYANEVMGNGTH